MKRLVAAVSLLLIGFLSPAAVADDIPMTIDGQINCAHPSNAITTTCRGEAPPPPVNTPPAAPPATQSAPVLGSTITYSGDQAADCSLDSNKALTMCIPMTINGEINCANSANAITTTCWDRAQADKAAGKADSSGVDCKDDKFKDYPICTGIKPQAVIDYEKTQETNKLNLEKLNLESGLATNDKYEEVAPVLGTVGVKSRNAKTTVLSIDLDTPGVKVKIIASKKGSKSITQTVNVNAQGDKTVKFDRNLKGYTIKILVDGEVVDQTKL